MAVGRSVRSGRRTRISGEQRINYSMSIRCDRSRENEMCNKIKCCRSIKQEFRQPDELKGLGETQRARKGNSNDLGTARVDSFAASSFILQAECCTNEQESPPISGAARNATSLIPQRLSSLILPITYNLFRKRSCMTVHRLAWAS